MKFKEQFPSFAKDPNINVLVEKTAPLTKESYYAENAIIKHCLDKQKVREAIDRYVNKPDNYLIEDFKRWLRMELKLENKLGV